MRRSRRSAKELPAEEVWTCPFDCGKRYRTTSSRSIQIHANGCANRNDDGVGDVNVKRLKTEHDEMQRRVRQREDDRKTATKTLTGLQREGRRNGSSADDDVETQCRTTRCTDSVHDSFFSSSSPDIVLSTPSPPSSIGTGNPCSPASASLASTFPTRNVRCHAEPVSVARRLQEMDLLPLQHSYNDTLTRRQQQVTAELQHLLLDLYARHGTQHPVYNHPTLVLRLAYSLAQETATAATARPLTTLPTQVGSFEQRPLSPLHTSSSDDLPSYRSSPPAFLVPADDDRLPGFDTPAFAPTPPADALDASAAAAFPGCASPSLKSSDFFGLCFPIDRPPSPLWPFTPATPPSRLARPLSANWPFVPFLFSVIGSPRFSAFGVAMSQC